MVFHRPFDTCSTDFFRISVYSAKLNLAACSPRFSDPPMDPPHPVNTPGDTCIVYRVMEPVEFPCFGGQRQSTSAGRLVGPKSSTK